MSKPNADVAKVLHAIHENFAWVGHSVKETDSEFVVHLPHLVSLPAFSRDEQREQVQMLTEISIKSAGVAGTTYTIRDTNGKEAGNPNWHHFYVEVHVPKKSETQGTRPSPSSLFSSLASNMALQDQPR